MITEPELVPCTFIEAWQYMKKYPDKPVCVFDNKKFKLCSSTDCIVIDSFTPGWNPDGIFDLYYDRDILDGDWQLIPQEEKK